MEAVRNYEIGQIVINSRYLDSDLFKAFVQEVRQRQIPVYSPQSGDRIEVTGLNLTVLWPESRIGDTGLWESEEALVLAEEDGWVLGETGIDPNQESIVIILYFQERLVLFPGDIGIKEERRLVDDGALTDVDILNVVHHGSKFSTGDEFLHVTSLEAAIILIGKNP